MRHKHEQEERSLLRKHAEKKLKEQMERLAKLSGLDVQNLVHELGTHQIELEMQNEELRRAREELESSRNRYAELYDFAPVGYFTFDKNGLIREVNLTGAQLMGIERGLLLDKPFISFIPEAGDRTIYYARCEELLTTQGRLSCEISLRRKDGTVFTAQLQSMARTDIGVKAGSINTVIVDITERKQMELALLRAHGELEQKVHQRTAELEETNRALKNEVAERRNAEELQRISAEMIQDLYENAPCGYHSLDADGVVIRMNDTELKWLGYQRNEVVGKIRFSDLLTPESKETFRDNFPLFKERGRMRDPEYRMLRKDGTVLPVLLSATAVRDDKGEYLMSRATIFDMTERKKAEAEVLRAAKLATLGELAASVAHEINNPVNSIINYAQILADKGDSQRKEHALTGEIIEEGNRIASIVKNLLSFARDTGNRKIPLSVGELISSSLALTNALMRKEGVRLRVKVARDLPPVMGNAQQLQQVFLNIISNASHALKERYPGPHENKMLEVSAETATSEGGEMVHIKFRDHGTGIPVSILGKVREPFFTTKPDSMGTGLGLSISNTIITDHKGSLTVESTEGQYTTITVELPTAAGSGTEGRK